MRLAVVTCVWQRPERYAATLAMLAAQDDCDFDLFVINNNPALRTMVDEQPAPGAFETFVTHNKSNRGPYARIELMHEVSADYDYCLTVDDDAVFMPGWITAWKRQADRNVMQGWAGFTFVGDYWQRKPVAPGGEAHYLWGSNLMMPAWMAANPAILDVHMEQTDDLYLCYYVNHVLGCGLRVADVPIWIEQDGKDSYHTLYRHKIKALEQLRELGWRV